MAANYAEIFLSLSNTFCSAMMLTQVGTSLVTSWTLFFSEVILLIIKFFEDDTERDYDERYLAFSQNYFHIVNCKMKLVLANVVKKKGKKMLSLIKKGMYLGMPSVSKHSTTQK